MTRGRGLLAMMLTLLLGGFAHAAPKLVILDLELTGDLGGPEFEQEHAQRFPATPKA